MTQGGSVIVYLLLQRRVDSSSGRAGDIVTVVQVFGDRDDAERAKMGYDRSVGGRAAFEVEEHRVIGAEP